MKSSTSTGLKKSIGMPQAIALYISAVLGSGILIVPGLAAEIAGPASLLAWGFMALFILPMALSMGLLSARYPSVGGVSHFVTLAFGARTGSLVGWFFLMSVPFGAPVAALTGAGYLTSALGLGENMRIALATLILLIGLFMNIVGMKLIGRIQIAVVISIVAVLLFIFAAALPQMQASHFTPFMPNGWMSVGRAGALLFWCFIGWEAVSHLSEEFEDPQRAAIKGVSIAAVIVSTLYFLVALATVGTQSYLKTGSDSALIWIINEPLGRIGALIIGITGMLICTATIIAYIGAASRVAYSLSRQGDAPKWMGILSKRYHTPVGALIFLSICFILVLLLYGSKVVSLTTIIQLPNASFILTYLFGCAAGVRLLRDSKWGVSISLISLLCTAFVFPFTGWAILYPCVITIGFWIVTLFGKKEAAISTK
ncbi:amino acid/polyamine/organocation transporter, APC superfamily [Fontibacillus panacisegetis]|uniref:Amino acid/polyamine/organocation transporter, APC superfamily n=1 Tax=Fontibacillus panacisegetis TaxID=670482 RepID=A0A1G7E998_9BACL|nr:amino acid permease [Fontibacillus panacisegetis]SDE60046.1 amino acid/polyamine/organocation transporter, APC superfamily [Fontibacillus panacisegetis]